MRLGGAGRRHGAAPHPGDRMLLRVPRWLLRRILAACLDWGVGRASKSQKRDQRTREARPQPQSSLFSQPSLLMSGFPTPPQPFPHGLVHSRGDHYLPCPMAREVPPEHGLCNPVGTAVCGAQTLPISLCSLGQGPLPTAFPVLRRRKSLCCSRFLPLLPSCPSRPATQPLALSPLPCRDCPGPGGRWEKR